MVEMWQMLAQSELIHLACFEKCDKPSISKRQTILGTKFSVPFFIAPAGYSSFTDPENGELNLVRGAGNQGALYVVR